MQRTHEVDEIDRRKPCPPHELMHVTATKSNEAARSLRNHVTPKGRSSCAQLLAAHLTTSLWNGSGIVGVARAKLLRSSSEETPGSRSKQAPGVSAHILHLDIGRAAVEVGPASGLRCNDGHVHADTACATRCTFWLPGLEKTPGRPPRLHGRASPVSFFDCDIDKPCTCDSEIF